MARDRQGGTWVPNECPRCESDDLVSLAELDRAELEEIERAIIERRDGTMAEGTMVSVAAMRALGQMWREDWSEFDGRTLRAQLDDLAPLIEAEHAGEDVRERVAGWCRSHRVEVPEGAVTSEREVRLRPLVAGASSEQEPEEPIRRFLWVYEKDGYSNWHTTEEPKPDADLSAWTVRGWDLDSGVEIMATGTPAPVADDDVPF